MKKTIFNVLILASLITCTTTQPRSSNEELGEAVPTAKMEDIAPSASDSGNENNLLEGDRKPVAGGSLPVISGVYSSGFLSLAYDGNLITGYYANGRYKGNPNFGCSFYFYGSTADQIAPRKIKITVLNPFNLTEKPREGTLKLHDEEDNIFSLVADVNADDCWDRQLGFVEISKNPGISFELSEEKPWLGITMATVERAYFHNDPDESTRRKVYVIKGDPLIISKIKGEWVLATFIGQQSEVSGWVKKSDTRSLPELVEE